MRSLVVGLVIWAVLGGPIKLEASESKSESRPAEELVGVWAAEQDFGPELRGRLLIRRGDREWTAEIRNRQVSFAVTQGRVDFDLPENLGAFRGRVSGAELSGFWIQPAGTSLTNAFATPVRFQRFGDGWSGEVNPLDDTLKLYWVFEKKDDGTVTGFLRNPDRNIGMFLRIGPVTTTGGRVEIHSPDGERVMLTGKLVDDRFSVFFPQADRTFQFERVAPGARGFLPGPGSGLGRPPELEDGWPTAAPEDVGLNPESLKALVAEIAGLEIDSVSRPYVHSILVARHGKLVMEQYFHDHDRDRPHDTRSAGKSFATALVGTAVDRGKLTTQTPVYELLARRAGRLEPDARRDRMTVEHLLTMSSGLACDDNDSETPGNEDRMQSQSEEPDWIRYALRVPMAWEPGEHDVYCSADMHLLAGALSESTGRWVPELFDEYLARPLEFGSYHLNLDPMGEGYLGGGVRIRARDFLKLGQLYLDAGTWKGRRVLSKEWIDRSVEAGSSLNEPDDYGYGWWIGYSDWQEQRVRMYYASGNGGQLIIVVPELDMVVAFQAANYANYGTWRRFREQWLPKYLLKAVKAEPTLR